MAFTAFKKSNWTRTVLSDHSVVYAPGAITTGTIAANTNSAITITVPYQFKGNGQVLATLPEGDTLDAGLVVTGASLLGPASGSYAAGNHPRVVVNISNVTVADITPVSAHDLVIVQY
jgi:hypothetical protein